MRVNKLSLLYLSLSEERNGRNRFNSLWLDPLRILVNTVQRKREILVGRLEHEILLALVKPRFLGSNNAFRRHPLFLRWLHIKLPLLELQWAGEVCCFFQPRVFALTLTHNLLARVSFLSTPCGRQLHHDSRSFVFTPPRATSIEAKYNTKIIPFHINFTTWTEDGARCFQAKKFSNQMWAWIFPCSELCNHIILRVRATVHVSKHVI